MRAAFVLSCIGLLVSGCERRPPATFHSAIAARFGPKTPIGYFETESKGSHATCGYVNSLPEDDGLFVFMRGALKTKRDPDFEDIYQRECPSMPVYVVGLIPEDSK